MQYDLNIHLKAIASAPEKRHLVDTNTPSRMVLGWACPV